MSDEGGSDIRSDNNGWGTKFPRPGVFTDRDGVTHILPGGTDWVDNDVYNSLPEHKKPSRINRKERR